MNGLTNFNFHCNFFFKKGKLFWKNHVRRGKHLLIMLLGDFFKNSNVESCFLWQLVITCSLLSIQINALS